MFDVLPTRDTLQWKSGKTNHAATHKTSVMVGQAARIIQMRRAQIILIWKPEGNRPQGRPNVFDKGSQPLLLAGSQTSLVNIALRGTTNRLNYCYLYNVCVCIYICIYLHTYIHTYKHTHTHIHNLHMWLRVVRRTWVGHPCLGCIWRIILK